MVKGRDLALDAALTGRLFDVTIYIYAGTVLGKQHQNLDLKNMSSEQRDGHTNKWFDNGHKQRDA